MAGVYNIKSMTLNYDGGLSGQIYLRTQDDGLGTIIDQDWGPVYHQTFGWWENDFPGTYIWIYPRPDSTEQPVETAYVFNSFIVDVPADYKFYCSIDNHGSLYVDGTQILTVGDSGGFSRPYVTAIASLDKGIHDVAVPITNVAVSPAGTRVAVFRYADGSDQEQVLGSSLDWFGSLTLPDGWPQIRVF